MVTQLVGAFAKYSGQAGEDEDDDDDDQAGIAAYGCLRAINTLLESVAGLGQTLFPVLEEALFPMISQLLSTEGQDVMEEVLEMLAYLTYYGQGISPRLWSLWPKLHNMLVEFGIDYWENILVPLDNMISRDTARFVGSRDPDYLASAFQMAQHSLTGDFGDREVVSAAKLLEVIMQNCRGQVDHYIAPFIQVALQRLPRTENRTLKDALVLVVANALYYNPMLALKILVEAGATGTFFGAWMTMIMANKKSGKPKHFRRMHDKKVCALGLTTLLAGVPEEALPAEVRASSHLVLAGLLRLLSTLKEQEAEAKAREEEEEDSDEEEEEEAGADEDWGNDDEAEEDDAEDDEYMKRLQRKAKELMGGDDDDDDSDDEWTDDEEVQTPIDPVDPYILLADALASLPPARNQALMAACSADAGAAATLQALLQHAEAQRQEKAKAAAAQAAA